MLVLLRDFLKDVLGVLGQYIRLGDGNSPFFVPQDDQGVPGLDLEDLPGLLGNDDLSPLAHFHGSENIVPFWNLHGLPPEFILVWNSY